LPIQACLAAATTGCLTGATSVGAVLNTAQTTFQTGHPALAGIAPPAGNFGVVTPPVVTPPVVPAFISISSSYWNTFAIAANGDYWAWGVNQFGDFGDGTLLSSYYPKFIGSGYSSVSQHGFNNTFAIKSNGSLEVWGTDFFKTTALLSTSPTLIGSPFISVAQDGYDAAALKADGTLWVWGSNIGGAAGAGVTGVILTPTQAGTGFVKVVSGIGFKVALKNDGSLWSWGGGRSLWRSRKWLFAIVPDGYRANSNWNWI
jgi:alpha-tubulin suppressor-like RCC1 family protein